MTRHDVVFRFDAGPGIGNGHMSRCLAVAEPLLDRGASIAVVTSAPAHGVVVPALPAAIDVLVLADESVEAQVATLDRASKRGGVVVFDHYCLDARIETPIRRAGRAVVVIDDIPERPHDAELLIDPTGAGSPEAWARFSPGARVLTGVRYALLRVAVIHARDRAGRSPDARDRVATVAVFFGGVDGLGAAARLVPVVASALSSALIEVFAGAGTRHLDDLRTVVASLGNATLHVDSPSYLDRLATADLAIGAGGVGALERACLGVPAIGVWTHDNQRACLASLDAGGGAIDLGSFEGLREGDLAEACATLDAARDRRAEMSRRGRVLVDGLGARRVADVLLELMAT